MNSYTIKVHLNNDKIRVFRMSGPEEECNSDKIREVFDNIVTTGGLVVDNSLDESGEMLEIIEGKVARKIDFLFLSGQNIDMIEVVFQAA